MSSEPFRALDVGADTTVFFRPQGSGIEGFVVDNQALVSTLKKRVLDERGLAEMVDVASVQTRRASSLVDTAADGFTFHHQFAEPFTSMRAALRLAPLDAPETESLLLPVSLLLALAIIVGLWALYRVAATQLEFAERQGNFVSAVTHELKTPLTAIRMHGEMLQDGLYEDETKAQEYYRTITSQAERLSRLIGNVLLLSNIERGQGTAPSRGDVAPLIHQACKTLAPQLEEKGFSFVMDLPAQLPPVTRDPDAVEQILFNLVDNALKYADGASERRITIAAEVREDTVDVSVRDRGPGVPESQLTKMFDAFYRGEQELTRKNTGTGLGLALVRDLAKRMDAQVTAQNMDPGLMIRVRFKRA